MAARARKLGGTLSVQSNPEKGTRVVLDLPRKQSAEYMIS
jgi:signal transduction histidine kinase